MSDFLLDKQSAMAEAAQTICTITNQNAKLEAANKVLYKALQYYSEPDMPLKSTAQAAIKAADEIMEKK